MFSKILLKSFANDLGMQGKEILMDLIKLKVGQSSYLVEFYNSPLFLVRRKVGYITYYVYNHFFHDVLKNEPIWIFKVRKFPASIWLNGVLIKPGLRVGLGWLID